MEQSVAVGLTAAVVAVADEVPLVRVVDSAQTLPEGQRDLPALPFGTLNPTADKTLELALRQWVRGQTGLELGYVEQLYTFGDRDRTAPIGMDGPRRVSVAYVAFMRQQKMEGDWRARWVDWHAFFPWEDWRAGRPRILNSIVEALTQWCDLAPDIAARDSRRHRVDITFGLGGVAWDEERVLERYELLYEAALVEEAHTDARAKGKPIRQVEVRVGRPMALDHRRILACTLGRIRAKLKYRPVVFELLPSVFTLLRLQRLVEALAGIRLHKQNFRRLVITGGLVVGTGEMDRQTGGRPAELFRFRREVLRERPAPGVGLPSLSSF
ncbi:MAG: hypothetical protein AUK47_15830 [Deltaproteobacteria bacterium CG2_30_63_29]|nr:MAG: hypothetical protein AUK47_15830 [Deltaproteobacteria bacterium CG2_30_63_29]PIV99144.1 MAG: hypothetical protein COW42_12005 [Deltaproteobacteria bacterium CG17_big_fil_post_rev_8_21_14_2_50_63_7]PJB37624.1 MAG: hypothetical protein CO108_20720 [Deltaproteobacteria bacterium CG_4_9_14_3_um_filter_63_12]